MMFAIELPMIPMLSIVIKTDSKTVIAELT